MRELNKVEIDNVVGGGLAEAALKALFAAAVKEVKQKLKELPLPKLGG